VKHISYVSSAIVYSMSGIFCIAILFGLKVGWDSMPLVHRQIWGMIVFYAISGMIIFIFLCICGFFLIKLRAQWKVDMLGVKEPRKRVERSHE
jgi:hypothetical protein